MIWAVIWYWILVAFTAADIITTRIGNSLGATELNPVISPFMNHFIEIKFIALFLVIGSVYFIEKVYPGRSWEPVAAGTFLTSIGVISNIIQLMS